MDFQGQYQYNAKLSVEEVVCGFMDPGLLQISIPDCTSVLWNDAKDELTIVLVPSSPIPFLKLENNTLRLSVTLAKKDNIQHQYQFLTSYMNIPSSITLLLHSTDAGPMMLYQVNIKAGFPISMVLSGAKSRLENGAVQFFQRFEAALLHSDQEK